jgi:hypothetical protein
MAVAIALSVIGPLDIYENHAKADSLSQWKAGMALIVVTWALEVFWAVFAFLPSQSRKDVATYQGGTTVGLPFHRLSSDIPFKLLTCLVIIYSSYEAPS